MFTMAVSRYCICPLGLLINPHNRPDRQTTKALLMLIGFRIAHLHVLFKFGNTRRTALPFLVEVRCSLFFLCCYANLKSVVLSLKLGDQIDLL